MYSRNKPLTIKILLYAEGNFSYTQALCNELSADLFECKRSLYEITATDFATHDAGELEKIKSNITDFFG